MDVVEEFVRKRKDNSKKKISLEINLGKNLFPSCIDFRINEDDFFRKLELLRENGNVKNIKKNIYYEYFLNDLILHVFSDGSSFCYKNHIIKEKKVDLSDDDYLLCYELFEIENFPNDVFPSLLEYNLERKNDSISLFFDGFIVNFILCSDLEKYYQIKVIVNEDIKDRTELMSIIDQLRF